MIEFEEKESICKKCYHRDNNGVKCEAGHQEKYLKVKYEDDCDDYFQDKALIGLPELPDDEY